MVLTRSCTVPPTLPSAQDNVDTSTAIGISSCCVPHRHRNFTSAKEDLIVMSFSAGRKMQCVGRSRDPERGHLIYINTSISPFGGLWF